LKKNANSFFRLHSNCVAVKGFHRCAIYDLLRGGLYLIPNELFAVLNNQIFHLSQIRPNFKKLFDELVNNEFFIIANSRNALNYFPKISKKWDYPGQVSNAIIFHTNNQNYQKIVLELEKVGCKDIQIIFLNNILTSLLDKVLQYFIESRVRSIELVLSKEPTTPIEWRKITKNHLRINSIRIFESNKSNQTIYNLFYYKNSLRLKEVSKISLNSLIINIDLYTESLKFNNFYNRKIVIDENGNIKRSIYEEIIFGNINERSLVDIVTLRNFRNYWGVNKDRLKICKDCEFRYCCVDDRLPIKSSEKGYWEFKVKCNYDPYELNWNNDKNINK
jgi:SPASM domain peptide maturase of grasp-with-spasm system